ncbi:MAG: hypothetical protein AAB352_03875 [Patescibacteria group bacterium]
MNKKNILITILIIILIIVIIVSVVIFVVMKNSKSNFNLGECEKKIDEHSINLCYESLAVEESNISICDKISNSSNPNIKTLCKDGVNQRLAIINEDTSYCEKITTRGSKSVCVNAIAVLKNDISLCDKSDMDTCIAKIAQNRNDSQLCEQVQSQTFKDVCFSVIGQNLVDSALCEKAGTQKDFCYSKVAVLKEDLTLCNKLTDKQYDEPFCYLRVAEKKKDTSICQMITVDSIKENCLNNLK